MKRIVAWAVVGKGIARHLRLTRKDAVECKAFLESYIVCKRKYRIVKLVEQKRKGRKA